LGKKGRTGVTTSNQQDEDREKKREAVNACCGAKVLSMTSLSSSTFSKTTSAVESVVETCPLNLTKVSIVIFVDYREYGVLSSAHPAGRSDDVAFSTDLIDKLHFTDVARYTCPVVRASLTTGDAVIARCVPRRMLGGSTAACEYSDDTLEEIDKCIKVNGQPARTWADMEIEPLLVAERKTLKDAVNSIQSKSDVPGLNRDKDQVKRMEVFADRTGARVIYIMERAYQDVLERNMHGEKMSDISLFTSIVHKNVRDGMQTYPTTSTAQTAVLLKVLARFCEEKRVTADGYYRVGDGALSTGYTVKKGSVFTADGYWRAALSLVPGISGASASNPKLEAIVKAYPHVTDLVKAYEKCADNEVEGKLLLENLEVPGGKRTKTGKVPRLGKALSARLYELFRPPTRDAFVDSDSEAHSDISEKTPTPPPRRKKRRRPSVEAGRVFAAKQSKTGGGQKRAPLDLDDEDSHDELWSALPL